MATFLQGESRRLYSWWWDSHISPKNSKWLQENLTDMDRNVKAMIKLIEEDADSFARRAEMYYKKRPELMKMVEEFYRAYRALAERYDHATGALRQAHRTITEAFPNQIPPLQPDDSPSGIEIGPHTPELPSPMRALADLNDLQKDALGLPSHFHARRRSGVYNEENDLLSSKKGLKQLKEMFPSGEGKVRKVLSFEEEEGIVEEKEDINHEIKHLQEEVAKLSTRNENLLSQMVSESQRASALEETIFKLESVKEASLLQFKLSIERISTLETNVSNSRGEINKINDEMVVMLGSVEEQCLAIEKVNKSLQLDLVTQQNELEKRARELEELNTIIKEEQQKRMQAEVSLVSLEQIHTHLQEEAELLVLEVHHGNEKLKDMELSKIGLEDKINELSEIISNICDENKSLNVKINDFQNEMKLLKETKDRLENELTISLEENMDLQKELSCLKEDKKDLEGSHRCLAGQMKVILERNVLLENTLSDANVELEGLRERANALEASCETLLGEVSNHVVEKGVLASKIEIISHDMELFTVKNTFLENSLSDANAELQGSRARFRDLEERCTSLCDQNSTLLSENSTLISQVEILERKFLELHDQHANLEREKDSTVQQVIDLQSSFRLEKQDHEDLILSLTSQLASLLNQIQLLGEVQFKVRDLEMEQGKVMSSLFEIFILQRCLCDMKDSNLSLCEEYQKLLHASRCVENQISQFKHKEIIQKKEIASLLEQKEVLSKGIRLLLEELNVDVKNNIKDGELVQIILGETQNLLISLANARDENQQLHLKVLNLESNYSMLQGHYNNLEREKDLAVHQVKVLEGSLSLQKQEQEAHTLSFSSQLASSQKQIHSLQEQIRARNADLEMEQQKTINADLENFVLQRCLWDMKDRDLILSVDCQNLLEAFQSAENRISQFEHKALIQKKEIASLLEHNEALSKGIHLLLDELNIDDKKDGITDEAHLQIILDEVKNLMISIFDAWDENQQLHLKVLNLESKYLALQDHHNNLEREKDSAIHRVMELENFSSLQKQEHEALTLSFSGQLASLQKQIHLLQEEIHARDVELEIQQQKTINADIEFLVLKRSICDMNDKNLVLSIECQDLLEALRCAESRISQFEHQYTIQNRDLTLLSNHREILRARIHQLVQALNIDVKNRINDDPTDEVLLQTILGEIRDLMSSVSVENDENLCLRLELLVLDTLVKQTGFDKIHLHHELDNRTMELLALERAKQDLIKMNKELKDEKNFCVSQVENVRHSLEILETKYSELEEKNLNLEREKDSICHHVSELECSLKLEKQEHDTLLTSSNRQLASLETQLDLLKKERLVKEAEFEIEWQNTMSALLENFILQRYLHDVKDTNYLLSAECQKLERERLIQHKEVMLISENNEKLWSGVRLLFNRLNINNECGTMDETKDEVLLQTLQSEIETMMNYISNCEIEIQRLHIEISVLVMLLKHIGLEKSHRYHELASQHEELLSVRNSKDLAIQILRKRLSDLDLSHQRSETVICNLLEEKRTMSKKISDLMRKMDTLEGENSNVLVEALTLDHLVIFFKSVSVERGLKLKLLSDDIYGILAVKNGLDEEIRVQNNRKGELEVENMHLMELAVLQEFDLNMIRNACEEYNKQVEAAEKLLMQKKIELSDAREENTELHGKLVGLNKDIDSSKVTRKALEKEIETLSSGIASKDEEITDVLETNSLLGIELDRLNCEVQVLKRGEEFLSCRLRERSSEVGKCEGEIQTLLNDTHISTINAAIFEEKVLELMVECESLDTFSVLLREILSEKCAFKNASIDNLKKKLDNLEGENGALKAELNAYSSLLMSLFDGVACVEGHILSLAQLQEAPEDGILDTPKYVNSSHQPSQKGKNSDLQKLMAKIESLQKVIIDTKNLLKQQSLDSNARMESAMKEIEELKQKETLLKGISKEKYVQTMKDIQLDQMSNFQINSSKMNRNENAGSDDQMLGLWEETAEREDSIEVEEEVKSEYPSCDLSIDKLEVSARVNESAREWSKRVNEKLDSDAQRLAVIQRSLQEFKTKLQSSERKKQPKNWEYATLKMQMREAEEATSQQVDINGKLKKKVKDDFESSDERRQILEQARKGSEKIGNLELELQKMEYIFLKVEEGNENQKNAGVERKSGILLSEYIHGKKDSKAKRKGRICGCIRPKTKG